MKETEELLRKGGITPTPVRILVCKCLQESLMPLSLSEIEMKLESVDKSTVSRTLSTFKKQHIVHSFNDGSGSVKYELCKSHDHEIYNDVHVHFRCEKCCVTRCLAEIPIPKVELPKEFEIHELSYVITGICSECSKQKKD